MKNYSGLLLMLTICIGSLFGQSKCDTLTFENSHSKLRGYFYSSQLPKAPTLLFTQGFMETGDIWNIGKTLSERGINVFMFDFQGCFQSEGKQGLMNSQEDLGSALNFLSTKEMIDRYSINLNNIILGGYSYGGHMAMVYAIHHPMIDRIISVSGGDLGIFCQKVKSNFELRKVYSDFFHSLEKPDGPVVFEYDDPIQELIDKEEYFNILNQTDKLEGVDILLTGGLDDVEVSLESMVLPIYRSLKENKQNVTCQIYQTGHSYKEYSEDLVNDIANWILK